MRITNNMMMRTSANNINGNKVNVDKMNNQMSSGKKIQRPSEDPVIAIRALRLRGTLSEIEQYYERNIPDAESWLEVTDTALDNIEKILTDIRSQCVYGATDGVKEDDREAILSQMQKLREQVYAEGNTDYAGRTIFTGYRTNKKLTFMEDDRTTCYNITQKLDYQDIEEHRYYSGQIEVPATQADLANDPSDPQESVYDRIRLDYGEVDGLNGRGTTGEAVRELTGGDYDPTTGKYTINGVKHEGSYVNGRFYERVPVRENGTATLSYSYTDAAGTAHTENFDVTVYETMEEWANATPGGAGAYQVPDDEAVFIRQTGELVLGKNLSSDIRSNKASLEINYTKTGFDKGELRPEYYHNCTDITDPGNAVDFRKYDEAGNEIYQDINYIVAANQTLTVNTSASQVLDASIGRDMDAMIEAAAAAQTAYEKLEKLKEMQGMAEYASDDSQAQLEKWIEAAQKEFDYADDNMQKLYNTYIGNFDGYLEQVRLAQTDVGSRGVSLDLVKNRMANQQTTVETLKSTNEDRELSDIIIDYTAAYNAYQAALQAASKVNQNTLLNYI